MPKPSCSSPPHLDRHGCENTSAAPSRSVLSASLTRPRKRTRRATAPRGDGAVRGRGRRPRREHEAGGARREARDRLDQDVDALARHEPPDGDDERRRHSQPEARARGRARLGRRGGEPPRVDARRHLHDWRGVGTGEAPRLLLGVGAGAHHERRPAQHVARRAAHEGQARGDRDLGAMEHEAVGHATAAPCEAERDVGVVEHEVGLHARDLAIDGTARSRRRHVQRGGGHPRDLAPRSTLDGVVGGRVVVRARSEHRDRRRVEALPQLLEVALDATHLRWEVVRDEQRLGHGTARR